MSTPLPLFELGFEGTALRATLVAAVLDGRKTSTTGLLVEGEQVPGVGDRFALPDVDGRVVAVIEIVDVRVVAIDEVDLQHVIDEGEGDESIEQWRAGHTRFFESNEVRAEIGDSTFTVTDATPVVLQRFRVVERYDISPAR